MVLSTLLPLLLSRALTATALPTLGQIHHNATAIDLDKPQIIEIAAASDWPTFLNTVLTNKPTIARTLMNHTNFGNAMLADGLCAHERVCITEEFAGTQGWPDGERSPRSIWEFWSPQGQLLIVLAASLKDFSEFTLAPVLAKFPNGKEARSVIEATMWLMGFEDPFCTIQAPYGWSNLMECKTDRSTWKGPLMEAKGKCKVCPINMSQRNWQDIEI